MIGGFLMDLYLQIGLLFVFTAALAVFLSVVFNTTDYTTKYVEVQSEQVNAEIEKFFSKDVEPFFNNPSVSGTDIYSLVNQSEKLGIAVLIQTKNQDGLVVNYGVQARNYKVDASKMNPAGQAKSGTPTEFEKAYVTTAKAVFQGTVLNSQSNVVKGTSAHANIGPQNNTYYDASGKYLSNKAVANLVNKTSNTMQSNSPFALGDNASKIGAPQLFAYSPNLTPKSAFESQGFNYYAKGVLYTGSNLTANVVNDKYSVLLNRQSVYYLDQNSRFYTTLIYNTTNDLIGVYAEEHGVNSASSMLGTLMVDARLISKLY